jgi:hypothetical protein
MSYSISTLLTRNLHDVFGKNDPARRGATIDEIVLRLPSMMGIMLGYPINQLM